jgi:hypothetical protein
MCGLLTLARQISVTCCCSPLTSAVGCTVCLPACLHARLHACLPACLRSGGTHEFLFHYRDDCPSHCGNHTTPIPFTCPCGAAFPDGAPHQKLYAARRFNWKVHYITKSGFGQDKPVTHDPPLIFNVAADPAEEFPVAVADAPVSSSSRLITVVVVAAATQHGFPVT